ncbi:MAG: hypothetical protein SGCHY_001700 [Lobulomycetales sp.]
MSRLSGKTVLITGASSGIGLACAREFAQLQNVNLILAARRIDRLNALRDELLALTPGNNVRAMQLDVSNRSAVMSLLSDVQVDVLVNNAGLAVGVDHVSDVPAEAVDTMFDVNVKGALNVIQAVIPGMKQRNTGHIINISSIAGKETYAKGGVYSATKHAVDALTRTLREELIDTAINVTSIDPGLVETEFSLVRLGDQSQADAVYKGLSSPPLTGQDIAESVVFAATRKPHVQIAQMVIFPTCQAGVRTVSRG